MRSARRASPPRRPDPPAIPRSTLQHPTCGRLQKPPVGSQSFAHSFADLSLPPITSRATPHLGSKITIVRTARDTQTSVDRKRRLARILDSLLVTVVISCFNQQWNL